MKRTKPQPKPECPIHRWRIILGKPCDKCETTKPKEKRR